MSASARRRRPYLDADPPLCFAHRGGGSLWPENTLAAFEGSLDLGARYLETDVHATRDDVLIAHHDDKVDATTNGSGYVRDLLFSELERLDAGFRFTEDGRIFPYRGKGLKIPKLENVFALSTRARINVDIKPTEPGVPKLLWDLIELRSLHDRILVASEYDAQLTRFRGLAAKRVATSASQKEALMFWGATRLRLDRLLPVSYDALQVPRTSRGLTIVDRRFVRAAHRHGLQVHVWTIDETSEMAELLALGVDGLISDRPDRLMKLKGSPESPF